MSLRHLTGRSYDTTLVVRCQFSKSQPGDDSITASGIAQTGRRRRTPELTPGRTRRGWTADGFYTDNRSTATSFG